MRRSSVLLYLVTLLPLLMHRGIAAEAAPPAPLALENEFVRVVVNQGPDEAGRFSIRTTGGDPNRVGSDHKHLIYGGDIPWTSYTTVNIDDVPYIFGGRTQRRAGKGAHYGETPPAPKLEEQLITANEMVTPDIEVTQELGIVRGLHTGMLDAIGIVYKITNHANSAHQVGLRVMLDTMCGENDGAPMRSGDQLITYPTMLTDEHIGEYWMAFDNAAGMDKATVVSEGRLRGKGYTPPNKMLFSDWGTLADNPWEPALDPNNVNFVRRPEKKPDTAAAMIWEPVTLAPEKSLTYVTSYGVGALDVTPGQFNVGMTAPLETAFEQENTQPFTIMGFVENNGGYDARDVAMTLEVPDGLSIVGGSAVKVTQEQLKKKETLQRSWVLIANGTVNGEQKLKLSVTSSNIERNQVVKPINVIVRTMRLHCNPATQRVFARPDKPKAFVMEVNVSPAVEFTGATVQLKFDPKIVKPFDVSRGRAFVDGGRPLYWDVDMSQVDKGLLTFTGRLLDEQNDKLLKPITQREINLATVSFRTVNLGNSTLSFPKAVLLDDKGVARALECTTGNTIEVVDIK